MELLFVGAETSRPSLVRARNETSTISGFDLRTMQILARVRAISFERSAQGERKPFLYIFNKQKCEQLNWKSAEVT